MLNVVLPMMGFGVFQGNQNLVKPIALVAPQPRQQANVFETWSASVLVLEQDDIGTTAFLAGTDGLIVSAASKVLGKSLQPAIRMPDNKRYIAKIIVNDLATGVALLQVHPDVIRHLKPIPIPCDGARVPGVGDTIKGIENRPTTGIAAIVGMVSVMENGIPAMDIKRDGYIAGSPLFGDEGKLIGMASDIMNLKSRTTTPLPIIPAAVISSTIAANRGKLGNPPDSQPLPSVSETMIPPESLKKAYDSGSEFVKSLTNVPGIKLAIFTPFTNQRADHKMNDELVKQYKGMPIEEIRSKHPDYMSSSDALKTLLGRVDLPVVAFEYALTLFERKVRFDQLGKTRTFQDAFEYHNGYLDMKLLRGATELRPVRVFRFDHPNYSRKGAEKGDEFNSMSALVMYDPRDFSPSERLVVKVLTASKPDEWITFTMDEKLQKQIWDDFADWRALNPK